MTTGTETETDDQRINRSIRIAVDLKGTTLAELGRQLMYPNTTWVRKTSDQPEKHQRYTAEDLVRIAKALGLSTDEVVSGNPPHGRRR